MREILQKHGVRVCGTQFGRQLGRGLFEFKEELTPEDRRSGSEIETARARLEQWKARQRP